MGYQTWSYTFEVFGTERPVSAKMSKDDAERLFARIKEVLRVAYCERRISNSTGQDLQYISWSLFAPMHSLKDEEQYRTDVQALFDGFPPVITEENRSAVLQSVKIVFDKHIVVVDERKTDEQRAAEKAEMLRIDAERREKEREERTAFLADFGKAEPITIPEGKMIVCLEVCFDNSDAMTDYFDAWHQIGPDLVLAVIEPQKFTESLTRAIVRRYPDLEALTWKWHDQNYSMGRGYFLASEYVGEYAHPYSKKDDGLVRYRYSIRGNKYHGGHEAYAYKDYDAAEQMPSAATGDVSAAYRLNTQHNGVEVSFTSKPSPEIIFRLKAAGFRWSQRQGLWYAKQTESRIAFAKSLVAA